MKRTFTDKELFIRDAIIQIIPNMNIDGVHRTEFGLCKHQIAIDALEFAKILWDEWQGFLDSETEQKLNRQRSFKQEMARN
jgi:hypothetical protein